MKRLVRLILLIICWPLLQCELLAQQSDLRFEHISIEQGLSQSSVYQIAQDPQGYLWFGTDDGLDRFDGYDFLIFKNDPNNQHSISTGRVKTLCIDSNGTLWTGAENSGLNRFDRQHRQFFTYHHEQNNPTSLSNDNIIEIVADRAGNIWIATDDGLNRFDLQTERFTVYRHEPDNSASLTDALINTLFVDHNGTLWIGSKAGLDRFLPQRNSFIHYRNSPSDNTNLYNNSITAIAEDRAGRLWIGSENGLNIFDRERETLDLFQTASTGPGGLTSNRITAIYSDSRGILWVGTVKGLNAIDPEKQRLLNYYHTLCNPDSLSSDRISAIFEDSSGALWFGTFFGGLNRYDRQGSKFISYHHDPNDPNSLSSNVVWSIWQEQSGTLWVGTSTGGLNRFDPARQQFYHYPIKTNDPHSFISENAWVIYQDPAGIIWIGSSDGLARYNPDQDSFTNFQHNPNRPDSISSNKVDGILADDLNHQLLWLATDQGLSLFDTEKGTAINYHHDASRSTSLANDRIDNLYQDQQGRLWISTRTGLDRFNRQDQTFIHVPLLDSEHRNIDKELTALYLDGNEIMWIGSVLGLIRLDLKSGQTRLFTEQDGLANNTVLGILHDKQGNLWLSTNNGLTKLNSQTFAMKNFGLNDGLQGYEFNGRAYFQSKQGEMFFGGTNGFSRFFPEQIQSNSFQPPIVITAIKLFNRPFTKAEDWLAGNDSTQLPLELAYYENFLSFEFAALSFQLSEKNLYSYKLEGIDKDWVQAGTRRFVSYSNLPPGKYLFRVKGSNNDGVWNAQEATLKFIIVPPLWRTGGAYLFYILIAISGIIGGSQYRLRMLRRQNLQLETSVKQRTEQLATALDQIKSQNQTLADKNQQLDDKIAELIHSQQQADRIFSALAKALPGTVLDGKYRLEEQIGAGGFGAVYRATQLAMKRAIAIKIFRPKSGNDSAQGLERFQQEGISASRINHPNAINIFDSGISSDGIAYLAMELLKGHTLKDELRQQGSIGTARALQIALPICDVLAKAHGLGIIHRDIKPDNIFFHQQDHREVIKVVDFGIAKLQDDARSLDLADLTKTGNFIGTPVYMAPERFSNLDYDGRADIYSLGVMLYQMISGVTPFKADNSSPWQIIEQHLNRPPKPLSELDPTIPEQLSELVLTMLAKEPGQRPTASELMPAFSQILSILPAQTGELVVVTTPSSNHITAEIGIESIIDGKYMVKELIGRGGMGKIFRVTHTQLNKTFALKLMHSAEITSEASRSGGQWARFKREAEALAKINHPNIVSIIDFGIIEDRLPYIVLEYIEGATLRELISEQGQLSVEQTIEIAKQICAGLQAAHQRAIVHRDLKPENIMIQDLAGERLVRIVDFGIAKLIDQTEVLTTEGEIVGTFKYMTPEQFSGDPIDARSDIFAICLIIFEMLTGKVPDPVEPQKPSISQYRQDVADRLDQIVLQGLSHSLARRQQSAWELRQQLSRYQFEESRQ